MYYINIKLISHLLFLLFLSLSLSVYIYTYISFSLCRTQLISYIQKRISPNLLNSVNATTSRLHTMQYDATHSVKTTILMMTNSQFIRSTLYDIYVIRSKITLRT